MLFLLLQFIFGFFKFLVLVLETVQLCLQLVRFLLLDEFIIPLEDLLDFRQTTVGETIALKADLTQIHVLIEDFKHCGLDLLAEKVISQLDLIHLLVVCEGID